MHCFSSSFGKELYMLRTDLLSIIRSLNIVIHSNWHLVSYMKEWSSLSKGERRKITFKNLKKYTPLMDRAYN